MGRERHEFPCYYRSVSYTHLVVQEIHARGMKVIIDGVFNHCGSFNKWLDKEHIYRDSTDEYAPVSYTHLDVYKRQLEESLKNNNMEAFDDCTVMVLGVFDTYVNV